MGDGRWEMEDGRWPARVAPLCGVAGHAKAGPQPDILFILSIHVAEPLRVPVAAAWSTYMIGQDGG
jgi:hypothetical protein